MKTLLKILIVLGVLGGGAYAALSAGSNWLKERNKPKFRTSKVERGNIRITVNATGKVKPPLEYHVGSFVSGPILELLVDWNDEVSKDQLLATIDPRIYEANVQRDDAALKTRIAEVERVKAQLQQARNDKARGDRLREENRDFIAQSELDQLRFGLMALEAQLTIAEASVAQARASLENSQANLNYTKIKSPVDGIVTQRLIEPGQTLAAQFQAPELFVIAPRMREKMEIHASVDEADIGLIKQAKEADRPVFFEVSAYENELFKTGKIEQIRLKSTELQNIVTYPVVVSTPNEEMKLLPDMTASLTFQVQDHDNVLKVSNQAIGYLPEDKAYVVESDHDKLDVRAAAARKAQENEDSLDDKPIDEVVAAASKGETKHVWIKEGEKLKAVEILIGVSDYQFTEVLSGDLKEGDEVVMGLEVKE
ncbi:MAG: efflux RND transporter periplasmic adaptor subunit [Planctomycetaceae bacterium]